MSLLRKYIWFWVIFGMVIVSLVITLIFILINKCLFKKGKHRLSQLQRGAAFNIESNKYQERNIDTVIPPLPPRTQFLTAEAQSYENLAEAPDHVHSIHGHDQFTDNREHNIDDYEEALPEYEEALPEYEEALDQQPDYVKVEDEEKTFLSLPPYKIPAPVEDNTSTEDYDDIGDEAENQGEEDYDDVG
ncbi:uncharacterized protein [Trachinotus anak]|uniref:uncharacterized protein n=1 Tax=Trachinotus anak TaxID=443729 RepID=UPI0039F25E0C